MTVEQGGEARGVGAPDLQEGRWGVEELPFSYCDVLLEVCVV